MNEKLNTWIERLSEEELPAFAHTARSLAYVSREDDSSADDLSNIILHDTAMTARILRIANSVHFNPTGKAIETVSYATVVLGFEQVRNIALTISMIDTVLDAEPQQQVQWEMVSAYHAAVQAQRLSKRSDPDTLEAVYIAALLNRLGPIIFWCFPFGKGEELLEAYQLTDIGHKAEKKVLGFTMDELTTALVSEWNLSEMLEKAIYSKGSKFGEEEAISIGSGIANGISRGWNSKTVKEQIRLAGRYLGVSAKKAKKHVYASARVAVDGLASFGFPETHYLMPPTEDDEQESQSDVEELKHAKSQLELNVLGNLTHMLSQSVDLNQVLMAVLEGIHHTLDMDQVVFALTNPKNCTLQAKYMTGKQWDSATADAQVDILNILDNEKTTGKFLRQLLDNSEPLWATEDFNKQFTKDDFDPILRKLGASEFLLHPIFLNNNPIGIVYADRHISKIPITEDEFQSFARLADYSTLAFIILSQKNW